MAAFHSAMDFAPDIFIEALLTQLLPLFSELHLYAMRAFGGYSMVPAAIIAIAGATMGSLIIFALMRYAGNWLRMHEKTIPFYNHIHEQNAPQCMFSYISLLAGIPFVGWLAMICSGLWKLNPWMVLPLTMLSHAVIYESVIS